MENMEKEIPLPMGREYKDEMNTAENGSNCTTASAWIINGQLLNPAIIRHQSRWQRQHLC